MKFFLVEALYVLFLDINGTLAVSRLQLVKFSNVSIIFFLGRRPFPPAQNEIPNNYSRKKIQNMHTQIILDDVPRGALGPLEDALHV